MKVGVRPEHLRIASGDERKNASHLLTSSVEVTEPMGFETYVSLAIASGSEDRHAVVARVPEERTPGVGETVSFTIDPTKIHLFHTASGERLA